MSLFQPAKNQTAFLKLGMYGFQGSGKTYTAMEFALGITKLVKGTKIAFFDTEKGSDFHIDRCKKEGIELHAFKTRSFKDLLQAIPEAEKDGYSFLVIDSVTHIWRELSDSYLKAKADRIQKYSGSNKKIATNLTMKDWQILKQEWFQFTDLFVNSRLHIAACGRAGFEYDVSEDEEGKQEIVKSGTKMKAEGEFGYESDLLLELYKVPQAEVTKNKKAKGFINRCIVLKDRTNTMNAKMIDFPKFKDFSSVIKFLNIGGEHAGVDVTRTSQDIFGNPDYSLTEKQKRRDIALEELQAVLIKLSLDGTSAEAKKKRVELLEKTFGTSAKTKIEGLDPDVLEQAVFQMKINNNLIEAPIPPPTFNDQEQLPF